MIPESKHLESGKIYTLQKNRKRTFYKKSQKKFFISFYYLLSFALVGY